MISPAESDNDIELGVWFHQQSRICRADQAVLGMVGRGHKRGEWLGGEAKNAMLFSMQDPAARATCTSFPVHLPSRICKSATWNMFRVRRYVQAVVQQGPGRVERGPSGTHVISMLNLRIALS